MTFSAQGGPDTELQRFRETVRKWVQTHNLNREALAKEFEVALNTVDRWWLGTARPHPRLREQIVEWIGARTLNARSR